MKSNRSEWAIGQALKATPMRRARVRGRAPWWQRFWRRA